jgi:hypothetical protein
MLKKYPIAQGNTSCVCASLRCCPHGVYKYKTQSADCCPFARFFSSFRFLSVWLYLWSDWGVSGRMETCFGVLVSSSISSSSCIPLWSAAGGGGKGGGGGAFCATNMSDDVVWNNHSTELELCGNDFQHVGQHHYRARILNCTYFSEQFLNH